MSNAHLPACKSERCCVQDYLLAPMPFLVGVPAAGSFAGLRSTPLDEITVVNLDAGTCTPGPGLPPAEPSSLPWAEELAGALQVLLCCSTNDLHRIDAHEMQIASLVAEERLHWTAVCEAGIGQLTVLPDRLQHDHLSSVAGLLCSRVQADRGLLSLRSLHCTSI